MPPEIHEITVPTNGALTEDFTLSIKNLPTY